MAHGDVSTTGEDGTRPLVYGAGGAGLISLALGAGIATQAASNPSSWWFASAMGIVGGLVLLGGAVAEMRRRGD